MLSGETQYLFQEKVRDGKTNSEAYSEVEFLKESQIEFKNLKRENLNLKKKIESLNNQIIKLELDISKKNNKNLLEGLGIKSKVEHKVIESKGATLNNIKRIINFTEVGNSYTKSDLGKELMFPTTVVEEIIDFLNRHTDIKFKIVGGRYVRTS